MVYDETRYGNEQFENDVRRIARALWPSAEFSGAANVEGQERDGVFETEDCIHIIEATTSRRKLKAENDIKKILGLLRKLRSRSGTKSVIGWFITRDDPTADQYEVVRRHRDSINAMSFSQFQARLIDSRSYLEIREKYKFGSVRNPATGKPSSDIEYVPLDIVRADSKDIISRSDILPLITSGSTIVLLGDYGAGKSMTLREVYRDLRKNHLKGETATFPVYINLRDHLGQSEPTEVIERHARTIGFSNSSHLVRAWRAGYVYLLIDGFDEISTINIQGLWRNLRENRYRAMEAVRRLIHEHPDHMGLMVAGRAHFFDNPTERSKALGLPRGFVELSLSEFTEDQITTYLNQSGYSGITPSWLPSRPLLIGYLAANGLLVDLVKEQQERAAGWNVFLDSIAAREAEIEVGIDGDTVRKILERLATKARSSQSGVGPLSPESVIQAFKDICGYSPDDRGMVLIQRLPGLGVDHQDEGSRTFVDEDFADACRSGDLVAFIDKPFDFDRSLLSEVGSPIDSLGIAIACQQTRSRRFSEGKINAALQVTMKDGHLQYTATDIVKLLLKVGMCISQETQLSGLFIGELELDNADADLSKLQFQDCFFSWVGIEPLANSSRLPSFRECLIEELEGRISVDDLPSEKFDKNCIVEKFFEVTETTAGVLKLDLPLGALVCLTVLKKIYEQSGSGRREKALHGGLDHRARRLVPAVLQVLRSEGLISPYRKKVLLFGSLTQITKEELVR